MVPHLFHRETTHPTRQGNPLLGGTLHIAGTTRCISTSTGQTSCSSPPLQALSLMIVALSTTNERERTPPVWLRPEGMQAWFCVPDQRGPTDETDSSARPERSTSHCSKAEQCESHVSSPIPKGVRGLRLATATYRLCEVRAIAVRNWSKWAACGESVSTENRLQNRRQWCITGHRQLLLSPRIRRIPNLSPQCLG